MPNPTNKIEYTEGAKVGACTFIEEVAPKNNRRRRAKFRCDCGECFIADIANIRNGHTLSCGCVQRIRAGQCSKITYEKGELVGVLTFIREAPVKILKSGSKERMGFFLCGCGEEFTAYIQQAKAKKVLRCKECRKRSLIERNLTHGYSLDENYIPEYGVWAGIIRRCEDLEDPKYGGRGIGICSEWRNSFETFLKDMGRRPSELHSIDRIRNSEGYSKGNCRWATKAEQARNRRSNILILYRNETKTLIEWTELLGLKYETIRQRIQDYGYTPQKAFEEPIRKNNGSNRTKTR